ncbi:unnamed protein product [Sphenostylis stenocarpa]|uniref:Signal recognition particle receptor subunit beta n=1 Tax=Sphenostylis stenocarpa TaxID=92480 RepID=A0AA86S8D2_9FABA|nr:unnamed protein product [Sphenostylis stenocarpa]
MHGSEVLILNSYSTLDTPDPQIGKFRAPSKTAVCGGKTRLCILFDENPEPHGASLSSNIERNIETKRQKLEFAMEELEQWKEQLSHLSHLAMDHLREVPPNQLYAAAAIVMFTTLLLLLIRLLKRSKSNTIVLTGLSGSGKTVIFYQLRDGSTHQGTVTSMEPNEGTFILNNEKTRKGKIKPVHIVDVPGHSRLRPKLDEYLPQAAGIVFVVDALDFLPNCRAASEYLYDLLTKGSVVRKKIPVLILCNKTDKVTAHTKEFIRRQMEKEIDKLRASRSAISDADIANEFTLGIPGETFSFTQCSNKVTTADASGLTGEISQLEEFIREHRLKRERGFGVGIGVFGVGINEDFLQCKFCELFTLTENIVEGLSRMEAIINIVRAEKLHEFNLK